MVYLRPPLIVGMWMSSLKLQQAASALAQTQTRPFLAPPTCHAPARIAQTAFTTCLGAKQTLKQTC